jgi:hypothetical protein
MWPNLNWAGQTNGVTNYVPLIREILTMTGNLLGRLRVEPAEDGPH